MGAIFRWIRELWLGRRALGANVERASATLPQTASAAIFNIVGGRVLLTAILGEVTVAIQNLADNARLEAVPTVGTLRVVCQNLNIQAYALGDVLGISGVNIDPMLPPASGGSVEGQTVGVVLKAGTLNLRCSANATGEIRWKVWYIPLDDGAVMQAA